MRAHLESLLRTRKLDGTLMSAAPWKQPCPADLAPTGMAFLDAALGGGLRRGHLSEIIGSRSSGRTAVMYRTLAAAAGRGEIVALVDPCDRFDPASGAAAGLDLERLLWIRDRGDIPRGLKAMNLVLQAGGFGVVAIDLVDGSAAAVRGCPFTTWMRMARVIEGSQSIALVVAAEHVARSPGGVTIALDGASRSCHARWIGASNRARLLTALDVRPRIIGAQFPPSRVSDSDAVRQSLAVACRAEISRQAEAGAIRPSTSSGRPEPIEGRNPHSAYRNPQCISLPTTT